MPPPYKKVGVNANNSKTESLIEGQLAHAAIAGSNFQPVRPALLGDRARLFQQTGSYALALHATRNRQIHDLPNIDSGFHQNHFAHCVVAALRKPQLSTCEVFFDF